MSCLLHFLVSFNLFRPHSGTRTRLWYKQESSIIITFSFRCAFKRKRRFSVRALFRYDQNFVRSFKMNPNIKLSKLFGNSSIKSIAILILMILPAFKCDTQNDYHHHHQPRSQRRSFLERVLPGLRLPRLGNTPTLDPDTVYNGVFDPSNIAIHVSQNFFNFAVSTLGWFLASFTYSSSSKRSNRRSFPQAPIPITIKAPPPNGFSAGSDFFNGYHNNHVQKRSTDEEWPIFDRVARSADDKLYEPLDTISTSKHLANMFRSLAEAADSFDR